VTRQQRGQQGFADAGVRAGDENHLPHSPISKRKCHGQTIKTVGGIENFNEDFVLVKKLIIMVVLLSGSLTRLFGGALPEGSISLPVLITWQNGETGSGFYLNISNHLFFCTGPPCSF
jgi:hypothetical protein